MKFKMLNIAVGLLLAVYQCKSWETETSNDAYISTRNNSDGWREGVMAYYTGCYDVLDFFPDATSQFGKTLQASIKTHIDYLDVLTTYNSTIISKGSKNTLKAIGTLSKLGKSREHTLTEWNLAAPIMSSAYRDIIWTLSPFIGELVGPINDAISNLEDSILLVLFQYRNRFEERKQERCEKISIEEMMKSLQILANRIALIVNPLRDCESCDDVFDSIKIAGLIANHYLLTVQGTGNTIASELISESENLPPSYLNCFRAMDPLLKALSIFTTSITDDNKRSRMKWLATLAEETKIFNAAIEGVLGPFEDPGLTVTQIRQSFKKLLRSGL